MKIASVALSKYIAMVFGRWIAIVTGGLATIAWLFSFVELMRRAQNKPNVEINDTLILAFYQLPDILGEMLPFIFLFAAMLALFQLNRSSELVVMRSFGVSIWAILSPMWGVVLCFSCLYYIILNPIGAELSQRFWRMESDLLSMRANVLTISKSGLWMRQEDEKKYELIRVARLKPEQQILEDTTVYSFHADNTFINRLDAHNVRALSGGWLFENASLSEADKLPRDVGNVLWKTPLTIGNLQKSFATPESLSIWRLPGFISLMERAGLSSLDHLRYFYSLLLRPFLLMIMVVVAAVCAYSFNRQHAHIKFVGTGLGGGFLIFFTNQVAQAMGVSMTLPLLLSTLIPLIITGFGSVAWLLHLEET